MLKAFAEPSVSSYDGRTLGWDVYAELNEGSHYIGYLSARDVNQPLEDAVQDMIQKIENSVLRGAELLDANVPGWHRKIDLEELNMGSALSCILGQLYGNYWTGIEELGLEGNHSHLGFNTGTDSYGYDVLQRFWSELIKSRTND